MCSLLLWLDLPPSLQNMQRTRRRPVGSEVCHKLFIFFSKGASQVEEMSPSDLRLSFLFPPDTVHLPHSPTRSTPPAQFL